MASKDETPTPAGFVESAKSSAGAVQKTVVDAASNAVNTATEFGKQAGSYVKMPEMGAEKKEESKVGAAASNVVDGAKEYGNQAQKGIGSGVDAAGAQVEKLKTQVPAKFEEMKKGTTEKKEESKVGAAATNVVDGAKDYGSQAQKGISSGVDAAGAQAEKLKTEVPAKFEEMKKGTEKEDKKDEGVFGGVKNFVAGLTK